VPAAEPVGNRVRRPRGAALLWRRVSTALEKAGGCVRGLDAGKLLGNIAPSLKNQFGSRDWWSWREQFLHRVTEVASEPACAGSKKRSPASPIALLRLPWLGGRLRSPWRATQRWRSEPARLGAERRRRGCRGTSRAGWDRDTVPYQRYLLQKVSPRGGSSGFPYQRGLWRG